LTLSLDPRIKRIKQEEKEAREAKKKTKGGVPVNQKAKQEEDKKKAEEEAKKREEEEKVSYSSHYLMLLDGFWIANLLYRSLARRQRRPKPLLPTRRKRPGDKNVLPKRMVLPHDGSLVSII
jgi:hypothetical protein